MFFQRRYKVNRWRTCSPFVGADWSFHCQMGRMTPSPRDANSSKAATSPAHCNPLPYNTIALAGSAIPARTLYEAFLRLGRTAKENRRPNEGYWLRYVYDRLWRWRFTQWLACVRIYLCLIVMSWSWHLRWDGIFFADTRECMRFMKFGRR